MWNAWLKFLSTDDDHDNDDNNNDDDTGGMTIVLRTFMSWPNKNRIFFGLGLQIRVHWPIHFASWPIIYANGPSFFVSVEYILWRQGSLAHFDGPCLSILNPEISMDKIFYMIFLDSYTTKMSIQDHCSVNQSCQKDNIARRRQPYVNTVYRKNFAPVLFSPFFLRANSKLGELNYTQGLI